MEESIEQGWEPPPLLAEFQDGRLLLQDGNHRYEAMVRAGEPEAWVLVWFDVPADYERYRAGTPENRRQSVRPAATAAPRFQHASRSCRLGWSITVTGSAVRCQRSPVVISWIARSAPVVSLLPCR